MKSINVSVAQQHVALQYVLPGGAVLWLQASDMAASRLNGVCLNLKKHQLEQCYFL